MTAADPAGPATPGTGPATPGAGPAGTASVPAGLITSVVDLVHTGPVHLGAYTVAELTSPGWLRASCRTPGPPGRPSAARPGMDPSVGRRTAGPRCRPSPPRRRPGLTGPAGPSSVPCNP
jgi:hypothetical protein